MDKKIVIAEDNELLQKAITFKLKHEGFDVVAVNNGYEAIEVCRKEMPDLIITDLMMPMIQTSCIFEFKNYFCVDETTVVFLHTIPLFLLYFILLTK